MGNKENMKDGGVEIMKGRRDREEKDEKKRGYRT